MLMYSNKMYTSAAETRLFFTILGRNNYPWTSGQQAIIGSENKNIRRSFFGFGLRGDFLRASSLVGSCFFLRSFVSFFEAT